MYQRILLPIDLAHQGSWLLTVPSAVELVRKFDAELHVVTVIPEPDAITREYLPPGIDWLKGQAESRLAMLLAQTVPEDIHTQSFVRVGTVYEEILRSAEDIGADLIVMAPHRPEMKDYLLGSNAAQVVRHAKCSVLIVRK